MDVFDFIARASALYAKVAGRTVSSRTFKSYESEFRRMWEAQDLDPLRSGDALNTYYHRRAALHLIGACKLEATVRECLAAIERRNATETVRAAKTLRALVERLEPAFALDPPIPAGTLPWTLAPSRWHQSESASRPRAENSKRHLLTALPRDWDQLLWRSTPADWRYRAPLAVLLTIPLRSEELVPGDRMAGYSPGVELELEPSGLLALSFQPSKSHRGLFGTERTTIKVEPHIADEPARYLARCCKEVGDRLVVSVESKNGLRKAMAALGAKVFPALKENITPNVARHQLIADMKKTFTAGKTVAAAAGHVSERSQSHYGHYQHGRRRRGYVSVKAANPPRTGFIERVRQLKSAARSPPRGTEEK